MTKHYIIIKVLDKQGNWYNNAYVENEGDAVAIAKLYRNEFGYEVQLWKGDRDISFMIESMKRVWVRVDDNGCEV